jgi:hypothetical protein
LHSRGLKPRRKRSAKKLGRKNWRKKGGVRDGWVRRCHPPIHAEERSRGRVRVVKIDEELIQKERHACARSMCERCSSENDKGKLLDTQKGLNGVPFVADQIRFLRFVP